MLSDRLRFVRFISGPNDPYNSSVTLRLHFNGSNGSTAIVDTSPSHKAVAVFGDAQISTAISKFGGSSLSLDSSGDHLRISPAIDLSSGDFCIEYWVYFTSALTQNPVISCRLGASGYWISSGYVSGQLRTVWQQWGGGYVFSEALTSHSLNTWVAICVERIGDVVKTYINGSLSATLTTSLRPDLPISTTHIGQDSGSPGPSLDGYIDEMRVTQRTGARYGADYTPATAPFPDS